MSEYLFIFSIFFICLFIYLFICLIIHLFFYYLFIYYSIIYLFGCLFIYLFISFWKEDVAWVLGWLTSFTSSSKLNGSDMSWSPDTNNESLDLHMPMVMGVMRLFIITLQTCFRPLKGRRGLDSWMWYYICNNHWSCELESRPWWGVLDKTLYDKVCQ